MGPAAAGVGPLPPAGPAGLGLPQDTEFRSGADFVPHPSRFTSAGREACTPAIRVRGHYREPPETPTVPAAGTILEHRVGRLPIRLSVTPTSPASTLVRHASRGLATRAPLRIGIDVRYLSHGLVGGVHTYVTRLMPAMFRAGGDAAFVRLRRRQSAARIAAAAGVEVRTLPWRHPGLVGVNDLPLARTHGPRRRRRRLLPHQSTATARVARRRSSPSTTPSTCCRCARR